MGRYKNYLLVCLLGTVCYGIEATNLVQVYHDALVHDPTFKAARAEWLANQESLAIVRADLLPSITAGTNLERIRNLKESDARAIGQRVIEREDLYINKWIWQLQMKQPLFDLEKVSKYLANKSNLQAAYMKYLAAESDLLYRVAEHYLTVLSAEDILAYNQANKTSMKKLLDQAKRKYEVGLVAVTDYEEAQARYDASLANEIEARNNLLVAKEALWAMTGQQYGYLDSLVDRIPLSSPEPSDMEKWVEKAKEQNFDLRATSYSMQAALESIRTAQSSHFPVVNASLNYQEETGRNRIFGADSRSGLGNYVDAGIRRNKVKTLVGGISAEMSLFAGGKVVAGVKVAEYLYEQKVAEREQVFRKVVSETRSTYLTIHNYIDKVKADWQALRSVQGSLKSTQASYLAGRRTMADVLNQQAELYNRQSALAKDEYHYIIASLQLKRLVGLLNTQDLYQINSWLTSDPVKAQKRLLQEKIVTKDRK